MVYEKRISHKSIIIVPYVEITPGERSRNVENSIDNAICKNVSIIHLFLNPGIDLNSSKYCMTLLELRKSKLCYYNIKVTVHILNIYGKHTNLKWIYPNGVDKIPRVKLDGSRWTTFSYKNGKYICIGYKQMPEILSGPYFICKVDSFSPYKNSEYMYYLNNMIYAYKEW